MTLIWQNNCWTVIANLQVNIEVNQFTVSNLTNYLTAKRTESRKESMCVLILCLFGVANGSWNFRDFKIRMTDKKYQFGAPSVVGSKNLRQL